MGLLISLMVFLVGCGYHWMDEAPLPVSVPLIAGDEDGGLTSEISRALHASGLFTPSPNARYRLQVDIQGGESKTIGFQRDVEIVRGKPTKNLIASEARKSLTIQVTLYDGSVIAYGPYTLTADADFDYAIGDAIQDLAFSTPTDPLVVVLPFSLGQLESQESAQEAATKPLYARLAQKLVDALAAEL